MVVQNLRTATANTASTGLSVRWVGPWDSETRDALRQLPEMANCPHELFERLATIPSTFEKRTALVTCEDQPMGVVALRRLAGRWELLTQGVASFAHFPLMGGNPLDVMSALRLDLHVNYWRGERPHGRLVRGAAPYGVHVVKKDCDNEAYWRANGHWGHLSAARRRTKKLELAIDRPGAPERIVSRWASKWSDSGSEAALAPEMVLFQDEMAARGRLHSFELFSDGELISGITFLAERDTLYGQTTWSAEGEYRRLGAGTRCLDAVVTWAFCNGFAEVDLGGGHGYKSLWAAPDRERWSFRVCPPIPYAWSRARQVPRRATRMLATPLLASNILTGTRGRLHG